MSKKDITDKMQMTLKLLLSFKFIFFTPALSPDKMIFILRFCKLDQKWRET